MSLSMQLEHDPLINLHSNNHHLIRLPPMAVILLNIKIFFVENS